MKLMCIKDGAWKDPVTGAFVSTGPVFGETVTPIESYCNCWILEEYPCDGFGRSQAFPKSYFVPLSDLDETEIHKEYLQQISEPVSAKAIPYMKQVRQWASETGLPFFTLREQMAAVKLYRECGE